MASTQIQTSSREDALYCSGHQLDKAGSRFWQVIPGGSGGSDTGVNLWRSDDGSTWTKVADLTAANNVIAALKCYQDSGGTWHVAVAEAAQGGAADVALNLYQIHSNVDTGTPGAVVTTTIDAGGAGVGAWWPCIEHSPTGSNRRLWISGTKQTAAGTFKASIWYAGEGTTADTAGNWTRLDPAINNGTQNAAPAMCVYAPDLAGAGAHRIVHFAGNDDVDPWRVDSYVFDPAAATPALGSANAGPALTTGTVPPAEWGTDGPLMACGALSGYVVFARHDKPSGTIDFYKSTNGTSWSQPNAGWIDLPGGRVAITKSGSNLLVVHAATFGAAATTSQALKYRLITASSDTMGGVSDFSDQNGNPVTVPYDTGTSALVVVYRGSTASPFTVRFDSVNIGGAGDTTPPGQATVNAEENVAGARIDLTATMPADTDVAAYEIRRLTGGFPAANRSDGTVVVAETATSASAVVVHNDTGLANRTRYFYRVFVKDTSNNWNTGATVEAVACVPLVHSAFLEVDGDAAAGSPPVTRPSAVIVIQLAANAFESGRSNHVRVRTGDFAGGGNSPPTGNERDYATTAGSTFKVGTTFADAVAVPSGGVAEADLGKKLYLFTEESALRHYSARVEQ
jgi:hypothetical protein